MKLNSKINELKGQMTLWELSHKTGIRYNTLTNISKNNWKRIQKESILILMKFFQLKSLDELFQIEE
jgi:undecaprenyl pyrophosphate synthase